MSKPCGAGYALRPCTYVWMRTASRFTSNRPFARPVRPTMTPAITPRLLIPALTGVIVALGVGITIVLERVADEPPHGPVAVVQPPVLELVGNHAFTTADVRARIAPDETPFLDASGALDGDAVDREVLLVLAFYWDRGYANVKAGTPHFDPRKNTVAIPVEEGDVFTMASVSVTGELLGTEASHLAMIRIRPGMVFSRSMIATDRESLSTFYQDKSYADANVLPLTKIDLDHHTIALTFEIERGYASRFERIDVIAKSRARADAIRSLVTVAAGQPYSETGLVETKRRLGVLGYDVALSTKHGASDALVVATIEEIP